MDDNSLKYFKIHSSANGGFVVWDDSPVGLKSPLAAFSSADDLLKWLEEQLFPGTVMVNSVISPTSNFIKTERQ